MYIFLIKPTRYGEYVVVDRCCGLENLPQRHETPVMDCREWAAAAGTDTLPYHCFQERVEDGAGSTRGSGRSMIDKINATVIRCL